MKLLGFCRNLRVTVILAGWIVLAGFSWDQSNLGDNYREQPQTGHAQSYRIGVGDLLRIEVYDEPDLTKETRVLTDGYISLPLLGSIRTEGLTISQLEARVTEELGAKYLVNPHVTVFVMEFSNVFVIGEVKNPGPFPIYGKMTVLEAVTLAGGFTDVANASKVKVIRHSTGDREITFEVNLDRVVKKGDASADKELKANDKVIVPRSFF